jgi:hypothetical protein
MVAYAMQTPEASTGKMLGGKNYWEGAGTINKRRRRHQENASVRDHYWETVEPDDYWADDPYWRGGWEWELSDDAMSSISCS